MRTYPNIRGKMRTSENYGPLRNGVIEENNDTLKDGIAGYPAAVVAEDDGWARVYLFGLAPETAQWPGVPVWIGPYKVLSEEVKSA